MNRMERLIQRYILGRTAEQIELTCLVRKGLKIGKNLSINSGFNIDSAWPWLISIGDDVTISTNVTILAHDASTNVVRQATKLGKVTIGSNVFIGTGATILCGVTVGDNVVIGAGSVVTHDLPADGVYAGVPAGRVCSIEQYRKKYQTLRAQRPDFSKIRPWDQWDSATEAEKEQMQNVLADGIGFI